MSPDPAGSPAPSRRPRSRPGPSTLAVGAVSAVVVLVGGLVLMAGAVQGPGRLVGAARTRSDHDPDGVVPTSRAAASTRKPKAKPGKHHHVLHLEGLVHTLLTTLFYVALLAGLAAIAWWLRRRVRAWLDDRARHLVVTGTGPASLADDDVLAPARSAIVEDAEAQEALLAEGTPRNGIVACWHRFEQQAERAGVPRRRTETSTEFTVRLLDLVDADSAAVDRLARLYREARFSEHELGEPERAAARDALRSVHDGLRRHLPTGVPS